MELRRILFFGFAIGVLLMAPPQLLAQQTDESALTYVAMWNIPVAKRAEFRTYAERNGRPALERLYADGTIVGWGYFATLVHEEDGMTHGTWFSASNMGNLMKALNVLRDLPPNPAVAEAEHRDYLYRAIVRKSRSGGASGSGYLTVSSVQVEIGKGREYRELWEKYQKPVLDELVADGTISHYELEVEEIHTDAPGWYETVIIVPNAESLDKIDAAFDARAEKRSAEERQAITNSYREVIAPRMHRDYFASLSEFALK